MIILFAVVFAFAFTPLFSSCAPELSFDEMVICKDVNQDTYEPVGPKDEFDATTQKIWATIKFGGVRAQDNYRYNWINLNTGETVLDKTQKYSEQKTGYLDGYAASYIGVTKEVNIIPPGEYKVDFFHNGELKSSANFTVNKAVVKIMEVTLANEIDEKYAPTNPTDKFKPDEVVYACVKVDYLIIGNYLKAKWYTSDQNLILETRHDIENDWYEPSYVTFDFSAETGTLPPDAYTVEIYLNDNLYGAFDFEIVGEDIFSEGNTYSNDEYEFSIAIPDGWKYSEKEYQDRLEVGLVSPSPDLGIGFSFIISTPGNYPPKEQFPTLADEMADGTAKSNDWTQIDKQESDNVLANGTPYKEFIYIFNDKDNKEWAFATSFIKANNRFYIFLGVAMSDNYDIAQSIYYGVLNSLVFK